MFKSNRALWAVIFCFALLGAACGDDDPAPTAPTPVTAAGADAGAGPGDD